MKNLTKIFMAVAVAMFAFACVTDTTEDLGVEVGKGGVTEITVSLEESRTQLGEKADGNYPLYWSEGDAIAVNGVSSVALTEGGNAKATFSFNDAVTAPYNIIYPASEGENVVTFLAEQPYTVGTFAPQAAPMYGYAANANETIQLNHLTGVLRFAIKGEKSLSSIVIAAEGKIAGPFIVDCTNGKLTPGTDATNTVTVTFAEPLALGAEATPIYVAVPAGEHGLYTITINSTEGEAMVVKYDSEKKPVTAGIVKEFDEILYAPSAVNTPEGELVIVSEADMLTLQTLAAEGKLAKVTKVTVGATIDMSGVADWQPIADFPAIEFDGGNDQGYAIKGLKAPLFGTTSATIKNLTLTEVSYTVTDLAVSGAIACTLNGGSLDNCSAAGAINIGNASLEGTDNLCHGGLVGVASAATIKNATNNINITVSATTLEYGATVAGVVGNVLEGCTVGNLTNNGTISTAEGSSVTGDLLLSGIAGSLEIAADAVCDKLINNGAITHNGQCGGYLRAAGVVANDATASFTNCKNAGAITIGAQGACGDEICLSGLFAANVSTKTFSGNTNEGAVAIAEPAAEASTFGCVYLSGVAKTITSADTTVPTIDNCVNKGAISVGKVTNAIVDDAEDKTSRYSGGLYMAGLFNEIAAGKYTNCVNEAAGTITAKTGSWGTGYMIGGIASQITKKEGISTISLTDCENKAALLANPYSQVGYAEVGGICGEAYIATIADAAATAYKVEFLRVKNSGEVTINGKYATDYRTRLGGFMALADYDYISLNSCENSGKAIFNAEAMRPNIGGFFGFDASNIELKIENCINSGAVEFNATAVAPGRQAPAVCCGGFIGCRHEGTSAALIKGCTNTGSVTLSGVQPTITYASDGLISGYALGGIVGYNYIDNLTLENCINGALNDAAKGKIYANETPNTGIAIGGITGLTRKNMNIVGCKNYATVEQVGNSGYNEDYRACLAGIIGTSQSGAKVVLNITNCENYGAVTYGKKVPTQRVDMGGIMATAPLNSGDATKTATITGCKNGGKISFLPEGVGKYVMSIGGIIGALRKGSLKDCVNLPTGHIYCGGDTNGNLNFGGVAGAIAADTGADISYTKVINCDNYGHVEQAKASRNATYFGGVIGYASAFGTIDGCDNFGTVTWLGTTGSDGNAGGVIASAKAAFNNNTMVVSNCANYADQTWGGSAKQFFVGGVIGYCQNRSGNNYKSKLTNLKNIANLTFTAKGSDSTLAGGICGAIGSNRPNCLDGGVFYGTIKAVGMAELVGIVYGNSRADNRYVKNVQCGGNVIFEQDEIKVENPDEPDNPEMNYIDKVAPITIENLPLYIYAHGDITAEQLATDNCTVITEKPAVPANPYSQDTNN